MTAALPAEAQSSLLLSTFYLNGVVFALDTALVEEVVRPRRTTRVAHSPESVLGIMNLRGNIVTVLDLSRILELGATETSDDSRLYIVQDGDGTAGLLVDRAADVLDLEGRALDPLPPSIPPSQARYFQGIAHAGGSLVTVLNLAAVLARESL